MDPNSRLATCVNEKTTPFKVVTGVVPATTSPMSKLEEENICKMKQNSRITMSVSLYTLYWQCVGFIYVALGSSCCGWYCGVNTFLGNAFCLVIGLQYPLNDLYSWFCNHSRHYWWHWMVLLFSSVTWILFGIVLGVTSSILLGSSLIDFVSLVNREIA